MKYLRVEMSSNPGKSDDKSRKRNGKEVKNPEATKVSDEGSHEMN